MDFYTIMPKESFLKTTYFSMVLDITASSYPCMILGRAGSGKSTIIKTLVEELYGQTLVTSPTAMTVLGLRTLGLNALTNHSAFGLPPTVILPYHQFCLQSAQVDLLRNIDTWILDECSMVRADVFDGIDWVLRMVRNSNEPFGGVRLILVGDLFQLPPVTTAVDGKCIRNFIPGFGPSNTNFLSSHVWPLLESKIQIFELTGSYRQNLEGSGSFLEILDHVRLGYQTDLDKLRSRRIFQNPKGIPLLTARKTDRDDFNLASLNEHPGKTFISEPKVFWYGSNEESKPLLDNCPGYIKLHLKIGMKVRFNVNSPQGDWINGSEGVVVGMILDKVPKTVAVRLDGSMFSIPVQPFEYDIYHPWFDSETKQGGTPIVAKVRQFPFEIGYATTIHKSQGQTINKAIIHLGQGAFEAGMLYVALSRVRQLEDLWFASELSPADFKVPEQALRFYQKMDGRIENVYPG